MASHPSRCEHHDSSSLQRSNFDDILAAAGFELQPGRGWYALRKDGSEYRLQVEFFTAVAALRNDKDLLIAFGDAMLIGVIARIADRISERGIYTALPSKELELLRHVRNAVCHGCMFSLRGNEPKRAAGFHGFELMHTMNEKSLWDSLFPGDLRALLDEVTRQLRYASLLPSQEKAIDDVS